MVAKELQGTCTSFRMQHSLVFFFESCSCHCKNANSTCSDWNSTQSGHRLVLPFPTCIICTSENRTSPQKSQAERKPDTVHLTRPTSCFCRKPHVSKEKHLDSAVFSFFMKKMGRLSGRDSWPPRGQESLF